MFLALLIYLLFLPINIVINSDINQYFISMGSLAKAQIAKDEDYLFRIDLRALFMRFKFYPLKKEGPAEEEKEEIREKENEVVAGQIYVPACEII